MTKMVTKTGWIGISVVALLAVIGATYQITDNTYFCEEKGLVMDCIRFSSSGLRCYPSLITTAGYRDCNNWQKVEGELEIESKLKYQQQKEVKYLCDNNNCIPF